jgi:diguanylate cyclase (GGDEF)-like protein/hemerythrin-like metal-binding protein
MSFFEWSTSFVTNLAPVDRQHRKLVRLINTLADVVNAEAQQGTAVLEQSFDALRDYAAFHFLNEEKLMSTAGVDPRHQVLHKQAHAQFLEQITVLWESRDHAGHPAESVLEFLSAWLVQHFLGIDLVLAAQMRFLTQGESAADAYEMAHASVDPRAQAILDALRYLFKSLSRLNIDLVRRVQERNEDLAQMNLALRAANERLERQKSDLERHVRERTHELEASNRALSDAVSGLESFSRLDGLLGIANRKALDERYAQEQLRARRDGNPLSLVMIDVDFFKQYNDTYGHQAGDRCLQLIAHAVASSLRRPGDFVGRYGGEELAVILPDTDRQGAQRCALQICQSVASLGIPHKASPVAAFISVSGGVATLESAQDMAEGDLIDRADRALYEAKSKGRNRICTSDDHDEPPPTCA